MLARFPRLIAFLALLFGVVTLADAQTTSQKTDPKKPEPKKTDTKKKDANDLTPDQVLKSLMAFFDQHDVNHDKRWSREEQVSAYGLSKVAELLKKLDTDKDGYISREEYEEWAKKEAPEYAEEVNKARDDYERDVEKLQQAYAKAAADAKARIQREIQQRRDRFDRYRRDRIRR